MASIEPADWEARAASIRQSVPADQLSDTSLALVLNSFLLADNDGRVWAYNGFGWSVWDGQQWTQSTPPARLELQPFAPQADEEDTASAGAGSMSSAVAVEAPAAPALEPMAAVAAPAADEPAAVASGTPGSDSESVSFAEATEAEPAEEESITFAEALAAEEPEAAEPEVAPPAMAEPAPPGPAMSTAMGAAIASTAPSSSTAPSAWTGQPTQPAMGGQSGMGNQPGMSQPGPDTTRPAEPAQWPAPQAAPAFQYRPTHAVPPPGMAAWSRPDPTIAPEFRLWPGLDVMIVEWLPSGWARVVTSNQWSGWVDGRMLQPYR